MKNIQHLSVGYLFHLVFPFTTLPSFLHALFLSIIVAFVFVALLGLLYLLHLYLLMKRKTSENAVFLEITPPALSEKSAYTTQQLFSVIHSMGEIPSFLNWFLGKKSTFSFEIVSTRKDGIRYLIRTTAEYADILKKNIISYLPSVKIREITDYLLKEKGQVYPTILEFSLKRRFPLPLAKQQMLNLHDPVAYITGMMTNLKPNELIALQITVSPSYINTRELSQRIERQEDILPELLRPSRSLPIQIVSVLLKYSLFPLLALLQNILNWTFDFIMPSGTRAPQIILASYQNQQVQDRIKPARVISPFEAEMMQSVKDKIDQSLFETTIRVLIQVEDKKELRHRIQGIKSSFAPFAVPKYQELKHKTISPMLGLYAFTHRLLSPVTNTSNSILSVSEIADLYHFPFSQTTKTENIVKTLSPELPAPLSLKKDRDYAVVFGKNTYGESITPIGLTKEERDTHMYIIGRTGSGKTTLMYSLAKHDIEHGEGIAFVDPHGDVSEDLLAVIPDERINDLIYINPIDMKYPIGINLLELTPGFDEDELELEKEIVCEGVISLFRKVFSKEENIQAHRIEYILRNTIYTAFTLENPTLFTIYDLLNNPPFQKEVIKHLKDENLQNFWKFEFGRAGNFQVVKMVGGVTAKVGRFLFSPTAKRILEQKKSTINFDLILSEGKILICNFSQGNLGEDTAKLLGTTVLTKIQQAALRRARVAKNKRKPFYLYIDEFQNFATHSFIKLLSEGRKYALSVCIAEQSTSQQDDRNIVNTILANVTTVICFRSANPVDEQLMLAQFAPYVNKGDIINLPPYHFYIKISAVNSEEPFSGETIYTPIPINTEKIEKLKQASRTNWAIDYKKYTQEKSKTESKQTSSSTKSGSKTDVSSKVMDALPED